MTISEQIQALLATRTEKAAGMNAVAQKAIDEGRTKDENEKAEFDTLRDEIKAIDSEVKDLRDLEEANRATATPVEGKSAAGAQESRMGNFAVAKNTQKLDKGIEFARFAMCLGAAKGDLSTASAIGQSRYPEMDRINYALKAAVAAGTTTDPTWASPLVEYNEFAGDFVEYLRPRTIIGQFGQNGIPALRSIPFNVHIKGQTSGGNGYWVGEGKPKPLTKFDFNDTYHSWAKVANIAVLTEELVRFSNPSAEALVRDALADAIIERADIDFIDPSKAAVANVSPASITSGLPGIASSGNDADAVRQDINNLWSGADDANLNGMDAVYITDSKTARALSLMTNNLCQKEFPGMSRMGGTLEGVPVIVSNYVPSDSTGSLFILAFAGEIYLSDDGMVTIDASREASLQMLDNPTNDSDTPTPTSMVSMFQTNSIAMRAERFINWSKRRTQAVEYLSGVTWGEPAS